MQVHIVSRVRTGGGDHEARCPLDWVGSRPYWFHSVSSGGVLGDVPQRVQVVRRCPLNRIRQAGLNLFHGLKGTGPPSPWPSPEGEGILPSREGEGILPKSPQSDP